MAETVDCWELNRFGTPVTGAMARLMSHYHHQGCLGEKSSGEVERVGERGYLHVSQRATTGLASPQTAQNEKICPPKRAGTVGVLTLKWSLWFCCSSAVTDSSWKLAISQRNTMLFSKK